MMLPKPAMPTADDSKSYAFYEMLPKFEVVVPEKDKDVRPDIKSVPETRSGTYVLQVGSYKNFADADRVRAKLALLGIESKVQKVSVENDTWYRIRVGPISKLDELEPHAPEPAQGRCRYARDPRRRLAPRGQPRLACQSREGLGDVHPSGSSRNRRGEQLLRD